MATTPLTRTRAAAVAAALGAVLAVPALAPAPALATSTCNQAAPQADLQLTQTITQPNGPTGSTVVALNLVNLGPCNAPGVVLTDVLPPGVTNLAPQSAWGFDPKSWRCPGPPYATVQVPASSKQGSGSATTVSAVEVSCLLTATLGVPQTASVDIVVPSGGWTPPSTQNVTSDASVSFAPGSDTIDPTLGDNESWAGLVQPGSAILNGTQPSVASGILQTTQVTFSSSGFAHFQQGVQQLSTCNGNATIGQVITIESDGVGGVKTLVFSYDSALNLPPTTKISLCSTATPTGLPEVVPDCTATLPSPTPDPCVSSGPTKFELGGREYFVQIVVLTTRTSTWWG